MIDKKKVFSSGGFPSPLETDEVKGTMEYGLKAAKAIEREWFYRDNSGSCSYYDNRMKYHNLRLYGRGEQDTKIYKDLLNGGEDSSYANYDWRPIQVVPKFVDLLVNQMTERLFEVKAEAVDKFSTDLKDTYRKSLEDYVISKPIMAAAKENLGVDIAPESQEELPQTQEEVDLFMAMKYKAAIEIAAEEAIKFTLDLNEYDDIQTDVVKDLTVIGIGAIKHITDPTKGIQVKYVDPASIVKSYTKSRDHKDVVYYGEVETISISELKRISGNTFSDTDIEEVGLAAGKWASYHNNNSGESEEGNMGKVDILNFTFKSTNTISYKKKTTKSGGFKMTKKPSGFSKGEGHRGYEVSKKVIDVWYEGSLILGTDKIFNYKLCENMIRPEGSLNITYPNYIVYAPEIYQNRTTSLVSRVIPYVDEMQQIHMKLQQIIAKARPNGIYIDVAGLNEIAMGDGSVLTPLEAIKMYDETGNILATSLTAEGDYNYGREPIKELKNGIIDGLDRLINAYNHYLNLFRDAIGMAQGTDASAPHPDMAVGIQQELSANSNTATRHILNGALKISISLGKGLSLRIKDIFEYSNLKETYINAIGKINYGVLEALQKYHLHDLGINITLRPDSEERQKLEGNITVALQQQLITLDDAIDIRGVTNTKLANEMIKLRRVKREKAKQEQEIAMEKQRSEGQAMVTERAAQGRQQELQMKIQLELEVVKAKSQAKMQELEKEAEVKATLMQKEFDFNMQLRGVDQELEQKATEIKSQNAIKKQDKNNTQQSAITQQKMYNLPAKNFESSEDNISGAIDLSDMEPS